MHSLDISLSDSNRVSLSSLSPLVDHSRVVLNDGDGSEAGSDYINANLIMVVTDVMVGKTNLFSLFQLSH